jgi:hypothetical protein
MIRITTSFVAAACTLCLFNPVASAQSAGVYAGLNSQGKPVEITVADDGLGGLQLTSALMFWTADCTRSGPGREVAWGVGANTPIVGNQLNTEFRSNGLYEKWSYVFSGNTVTGTFMGRTPEFTDVSSSTRKVQLCDSGNLSFSADLAVPTANRQGLKPGETMRLN